ncbi:nitrous oxide reductase accessory protein NosL [Haloplanus litoreus]|uniref:Nitrous oxide reductase accessory protein NosL n=1 Tax=Haloplanus litoreus TaxID=767515 RepID=A0ABD5ZZL3_9EURY
MTDTTPPSRLTRRRFVTAGLGALTAGLAGCAGGPVGDGGTATPTGTAAPDTDAALSEPATVPEDAECGVCNMMPAKYPDYNAQLTVEAGDRVFFCSPGCMAAYYVDPGHFEAAHEGATVADVWVHDHETTDLIDAETGWFVRETEADRVPDPMGANPVPFAAEGDANAYIETYDDLSASALLRLEDFDMELARFYRGRFFE